MIKRHKLSTKFTGKRCEIGLLCRYEAARLLDGWTMEQRINKDETPAKTLRVKMVDHLNKGYIRKLSVDELCQNYQRVWYPSVFPVINPNKPGKERFVWDAAAKAIGVSLNSVLLLLVFIIFPVLIHFREHTIVLTGEAREMFELADICTLDEPYRCR